MFMVNWFWNVLGSLGLYNKKVHSQLMLYTRIGVPVMLHERPAMPLDAARMSLARCFFSCVWCSQRITPYLSPLPPLATRKLK
jgi:hypothetical protein